MQIHIYAKKTQRSDTRDMYLHVCITAVQYCYNGDVNFLWGK